MFPQCGGPDHNVVDISACEGTAIPEDAVQLPLHVLDRIAVSHHCHVEGFLAAVGVDRHFVAIVGGDEPLVEEGQGVHRGDKPCTPQVGEQILLERHLVTGGILYSGEKHPGIRACLVNQCFSQSIKATIKRAA